MTYTANKDGTLREQAEYWLGKAAAYDAESSTLDGDAKANKSKFCEMAFKKALACEDAAISAGA